MMGRPSFFDVDKYLDCVEGMITADEVERALWMLDNPPAYFRDNEPERLKEIRQSLHQALFTPTQYALADTETHDCDVEELKQYFPPRAEILGDLVNELNKDGKSPNILEIGPGAFWLPHSLTAQGLKFQYGYQSLGGPGFESKLDVDAVNIFVAFELIEHLHNEWEIYQAYLKFNRKAQHVFLSTPTYTYGGGMREWRGQALGHLRAYTPREFFNSVSKMFQGFTFKVLTCVDGTTVIRGDRV